MNINYFFNWMFILVRFGKKWLNDFIVKVLLYCIEKFVFYLKGNVIYVN